MIVQTAPENQHQRFVITMQEHTALARQFAERFGNDEFDAIEPNRETVFLVGNHDIGWKPLDDEPKINQATGLPYNLTETPLEDTLWTSRRSPEINEQHHPFCGLLSSMHSWGLYNGRFGLSDTIALREFSDDDKPKIEAMLEDEKKRQERLISQLESDPQTADWVNPEDLFQNYKQLQLFDTLALYFNMRHEGARSATQISHVPLSAQDDVTVSVTPLSDGQYHLAPWPFDEPEFSVEFSGRYLEPTDPADGDEMRAKLRSQDTESQRVTLTSRG